MGVKHEGGNISKDTPLSFHVLEGVGVVVFFQRPSVGVGVVDFFGHFWICRNDPPIPKQGCGVGRKKRYSVLSSPSSPSSPHISREIMDIYRGRRGPRDEGEKLPLARGLPITLTTLVMGRPSLNKNIC